MKKMLVVGALAAVAIVGTAGFVSAGQRNMHRDMRGDIGQMHDQMMGSAGVGMGMGSAGMQQHHGTMPEDMTAQHAEMHANMPDGMQELHDQMHPGGTAGMPCFGDGGSGGNKN